MRKKTMIVSTLLCMIVSAMISTAAMGSSIDTQVRASWKIDAKPLDIVHTLDNKRVFILADDNQVHIFSAEGQKQGAIKVDKGVSAIDIAPRGELLYLMNSADNSFTSLSVNFTTNIDVTGAPFLGKENAPVVLALFSDFQWPYCASIQPLLEQVLEKNPDTLKIAFKHLPLTSIHDMAEPAALAAIAAQNQGKFWQMHDELFAMNSITPQAITGAAQKIGLDMDTFNKDVLNPSTRQRLVKDVQDARAADVNGTPTLFVNGRRVNDRSQQALQSLINQELAKTK